MWPPSLLEREPGGETHAPSLVCCVCFEPPCLPVRLKHVPDTLDCGAVLCHAPCADQWRSQQHMTRCPQCRVVCLPHTPVDVVLCEILGASGIRARCAKCGRTDTLNQLWRTHRVCARHAIALVDEAHPRTAWGTICDPLRCRGDWQCQWAARVWTAWTAEPAVAQAYVAGLVSGGGAGSSPELWPQLRELVQLSPSIVGAWWLQLPVVCEHPLTPRDLRFLTEVLGPTQPSLVAHIQYRFSRMIHNPDAAEEFTAALVWPVSLLRPALGGHLVEPWMRDGGPLRGGGSGPAVHFLVRCLREGVVDKSVVLWFKDPIAVRDWGTGAAADLLRWVVAAAGWQWALTPLARAIAQGWGCDKPITVADRDTTLLNVWAAAAVGGLCQSSLPPVPVFHLLPHLIEAIAVVGNPATQRHLARQPWFAEFLRCQGSDDCCVSPDMAVALPETTVRKDAEVRRVYAPTLQDTDLDGLRRAGWGVLRHQAGLPLGAASDPDILAVLDDRWWPPRLARPRAALALAYVRDVPHGGRSTLITLLQGIAASTKKRSRHEE